MGGDPPAGGCGGGDDDCKPHGKFLESYGRSPLELVCGGSGGGNYFDLSAREICDSQRDVDGGRAGHRAVRRPDPVVALPQEGRPQPGDAPGARDLGGGGPRRERPVVARKNSRLFHSPEFQIPDLFLFMHAFMCVRTGNVGYWRSIQRMDKQ